MKLWLVVLLSLNVFATLGRYVVNDQHSYINFEIPFMGISKVKGQFPRITANFEFDEESKKFGKIIAQVTVDRINTGDSRRDQHLKSSDFFHASKYPHFTFESTRIKYNQKGEPQKIQGNVNIKGVVKPVDWPINYRGVKQDDKGFKSLFFVINGSISRKAFNLNWNKVIEKGEFVIGDIVDFELVIEAHPFGKVPQFSRFFTRNKEERELSKNTVENQNPLLTSIEVNSTLQKEIQNLKDAVSSEKRMNEFYQDEINRLKFEKSQLAKEIADLQKPPLPWWQRIVILILGAALCFIVSFFIIKHKIKTDDGDIFDYLKPTKTRFNAVLDGVFVFSIFCFAWIIFKYVI